MGKPCGHPAHPEDDNIGRVDPTKGPRVERGADVKAHLADPSWFVGRSCKLGFPIPQNIEYMWVKVTGLTGSELEGTLQNTPVYADVSYGDRVAFTTDEIVDVSDA